VLTQILISKNLVELLFVLFVFRFLAPGLVFGGVLRLACSADLFRAGLVAPWLVMRKHLMATRVQVWSL
jgi:hypothetical protein